jgi:hypothetical protein
MQLRTGVPNPQIRADGLLRNGFWREMWTNMGGYQTGFDSMMFDPNIMIKSDTWLIL